MAQLNAASRYPTNMVIPRTHEGAPAAKQNAMQELLNLVMANMLWEDNFYIDGMSIANRIGELVHQVTLAQAAAVAIEARNNMKLRHVPLLIVREMARHPKATKALLLPENTLDDTPNHRGWISRTLAEVIQRPDELSEFMAIYWKDGKQPLSKQVKLGLARAFAKFNEYQLAKYNRKKDIMLRDVLFLCHSKPADASTEGRWTKFEREAFASHPGAGQKRVLTQCGRENFSQGELLYGKLIYDQLATPDTWEVELSAGKDKKATFERLMKENQLGDLAFLRNLRNMHIAGVSTALIQSYGDKRNWGRVLPFRFISAARAVPQLEPMLERWMLKCVEGAEKLPGKTILLCDVSSSMGAMVSQKSDLTRRDAMKALAILLREICGEVVIIPFAQNPLPAVAPRRGFALGDLIERGRNPDGTRVGAAAAYVQSLPHDRLIILTDEQSQDPLPTKLIAPQRSYVINVAAHQNGIARGDWLKINGWSEAVIDYLRYYESTL